MTKAQLRHEMKALLARTTPAELARASRSAAVQLLRSAAWTDARLVLCFLSMPGEIDTAPVLEAARAAGKSVAVPRIEGSAIRFVLLGAEPGAMPRDRWGIPVPDARWPEPDLAAAGSILVVTPGLAFDREGNRLGRGGGFYDGFLRQARTSGIRLSAIGICLAAQLVSAVPHDAHDEPVDSVATDEQLILRPPG